MSCLVKSFGLRYLRSFIPAFLQKLRKEKKVFDVQKAKSQQRLASYCRLLFDEMEAKVDSLSAAVRMAMKALCDATEELQLSVEDQFRVRFV